MTSKDKLIKKIRLKKELRKRQVTASFHEFVLDAFGIINPNDKLKSNWHIKYICDALQSEVERINKGEKKTKDIIIERSFLIIYQYF